SLRSACSLRRGHFVNNLKPAFGLVFLWRLFVSACDITGAGYASDLAVSWQRFQRNTAVLDDQKFGH
ncbi:hypothetical protein FKW85_13350, partial [Yersinia pestis]